MKINISRMARQDLMGIYRYISEVLKNPDSAKDIVQGIITQIDLLSENPFHGSPVVLENTKITSFYSVKYKNYLAFYKIAGKEIFVDRILYARRNLLDLLSQ